MIAIGLRLKMYKIYEVSLPTNVAGFEVAEVERFSVDQTFIPDWKFHFGTERTVPEFATQDEFAEWLLGSEVLSNHEVADEMWGAL